MEHYNLSDNRYLQRNLSACQRYNKGQWTGRQTGKSQNNSGLAYRSCNAKCTTRCKGTQQALLDTPASVNSLKQWGRKKVAQSCLQRIISNSSRCYGNQVTTVVWKYSRSNAAKAQVDFAMIKKELSSLHFNCSTSLHMGLLATLHFVYEWT